MSTYLIDFENVKSGGLAGIDHIRKEDSVHLFWSVRENKISIEMMELIRSSESEIVMHKAVTGERDALDHQLCSYLGYLAGGKGETDFVIVSNDKAYDHLIEFWRKMNNEVHIRRVSEIAGVSETLSVNPEAVLPAVPEEKTVQTDKSENTVSEAVHAVSDTYAGRNSRRRERGSKYLKGGKTGRIARKNAHSEEYQEEDRTADRVRETAQERVAETAKESEKGSAEYSVDNSPGEKQAEPRRDSAAAYVVTGIKTGILVESGFTADGILDNRNNSEMNGKRNGIKTVQFSGTAEINGQAKQMRDEKAADKQAEDPVEKETADKQTEKPVKEETADKQTEEPVEEETADKRTEKPVEEEAAARQAEEPVREKVTEIQPEKSEKEVDKQTSDMDAAAGQPAGEKEVDVQEKNEAEKKPRTRTTRTSARSKRGRPPKKERIEHLPEIKLPIIKSDVVAKCEEAADAEWTDEVVRLINESKDKKELYSAIVKLLGQEKGRMVYHEIKILK